MERWPKKIYKEMNRHRKEFSEVYTFGKKDDFVTDTFHENVTSTVFDMYIVEKIKEFLRQTFLDVPVQNLFYRTDSAITIMTSKRRNGLKPSTYGRTVVKHKPMEKSFRKMFNGLQGMEIIPENVLKT